MMTSAYSQLFAQGLLVSAYAPRGASHSEDAPTHEPTVDSKRAGPIAALRTPTQIATKALSRLLRATTRSNSKARAPPAHSHSVSLGGLGRRGEVTLPPRQPLTPRNVPKPPPPSRATSSMSISSDDSFLEFDRSPSPPPFAYDIHTTTQKQPSHAATLFPHLERHNMTAAELHNALVAPYMPGGQHYPRPHWLAVDDIDDDDASYDYDYAHPYRRADDESADDDDMVC